jgi:hypothetical protein
MLKTRYSGYTLDLVGTIANNITGEGITIRAKRITLLFKCQLGYTRSLSIGLRT